MKESNTIEWGINPTFGPPTNKEIEEVMALIQRAASHQNIMVFQTRPEMIEWLKANLKGTHVDTDSRPSNKPTGTNRVNVVIARTKEDLDYYQANGHMNPPGGDLREMNEAAKEDSERRGVLSVEGNVK